MVDEEIEKIAEGVAPVPDTVLAQVPRGAAALAALTVVLLLIAWLAVYVFVFLPRGPVG